MCAIPDLWVRSGWFFREPSMAALSIILSIGLSDNINLYEYIQISEASGQDSSFMLKGTDALAAAGL
jgi:hypothetical protein